MFTAQLLVPYREPVTPLPATTFVAYILPVTIIEPLTPALPVYGNDDAAEALSAYEAVKAYDAVPSTLPVIPFVTDKVPDTYTDPLTFPPELAKLSPFGPGVSTLITLVTLFVLEIFDIFLLVASYFFS